MPATVRPCGTDALQEVWRKDASFLARERAINKAILQKQYITVPGAPLKAAGLVVLPVVFHIISEDPAANPDAAVLAALKELNDAYAATGAFTGGRTDTKIQFCLAKTAPDGGKTTGIVRTHSYLTDFDNEMEGGDLTALGRWDPARYVNIWVVTDIKSEYMQDFACGSWTRLKMGGYASAGGDIVVAGLGVGVLAHEMGHYLSLAHTFANRDCKNDDCLTDGDMVCDTPPEKTITGGYACGVPQNSCSSDTLSGFTVDVPDLPDNFMDYGQGIGCILSFTAGQAARMHSFIDVALPGMLASTVCNEPCAENITSSFTRDIDYPVIGNVVTFTSTGTGANAYQWLVDGVPSGTAATLQLTVTRKKNYEVILRVTNTVSGCFATTNDVVSVSCGVVARFWPSKRKIASKDGIELDSVYFTNRSRNATSWSWLMSNDKGMTEQEISTAEQLKYVFKTPANYRVRLAVTDGHCFDTSNAVKIVVDDPTADGAVYVTKIECYQQTKVRVTLYFHNFGYHTIPKNTPVSFYDGDPRKPGTKKVGAVWALPADLKGKCSSALLSTIVDVGKAGINDLGIVLNDDGSTLPLALPNTTLVETSYGNNISVKHGFKFKVTLNPNDYTLTPEQQVVLKPQGANGTIQSAKWTGNYLDCSDCINATFTAPYRKDTVTQAQVMAYTQYACYDSTIATLHIPVVDDYTVTMKAVDCSRGDSLHVDFSLCNLYPKGNIPAQLPVSFYDRTPADPAAQLLGKGFSTPLQSAGTCADYGYYIRQSTTGAVYAIVNKDKIVHPPATGLNEADYNNNTQRWQYVAPVASVFPLDTVVMRKATFPLYYGVSNFTPTNILWQNDIAYTLSCYNCPSPVAAMKDSAFVGVQLTNKYGCVIKGRQYVRIFPPDFTISLLKMDCFDNDHILVSFRICTANGYDSIHAGIPVSFYNGDPSSEQTSLLLPLFHTPVTTGVCRDFTTVLSAPRSNNVTAIVNRQTNFVMDETNYANNLADAPYTPFTVSLTPSVIELPRPAAVNLHALIDGGPASAYAWEPVSGLSCSNCAWPRAAATSSMRYTVTATNQYYCTDTATVHIKTFTNFGISMPNAFTPNGDGQNDWFYVIGSWDIKQLRDFHIYNRLGNVVFEAHNTPANDRSYGWDGNVNGKPSPMGTYVYFATVEFLDGTTQLVKGTVTLIR
ncbi:gliding motility-associated C-terminal domain-containing protein [Chitinophaga sp. 22321]|uniref:Gliding motility-associated C-terminal domain-containing protein n=1 Tax=Chitinophaga hostae TaxID=2831022 RepID=A0ABS5J9U0_9BACT|nr:gliding motility-associated C-terminal domain-containing protein [Chitinophaga hostae]MBS0031972.1 gliding motility-associated C-terminal domain-containing protein [Chitinophaga hostae]